MNAPSLAWRVILSHYLSGLFGLPGAILIAVWATGGHFCGLQDLSAWAERNKAISLGAVASFALTVGPLLLGVLLDDVRHLVEDCLFKGRWPKAQEHLVLLDLRSHNLLRYMHDEYYYYVEFDGNSALGFALSFIGLFVYYRTVCPEAHALGLFAIGAIVGSLVLAIIYRKNMRDWFDDVKDMADYIQGHSAQPSATDGQGK